ncbi:MAG TPA: flagellin [Bryobacteraceae bacterium]|nr:flagellin [Bryobacteraceae bacterium]
MISSLSASNQQFINNLQQITGELNDDALAISSGVEMREVSDNPDQVSELLQARAALATSQQISTNLSSVTTEVNTGEQALQTAVQQFDLVQTLGAQGATGTQTASSRAALALQLQTIEQQFVGLANTNIGGRYIFAGDQDQTAPYIYDPTQANPVSAYQGSPSTRITQDAEGGTFPIALTAQQIFDSSDPTTNVFTAINNLITALNNNDQTATAAQVNGLANVAVYLNTQLAFYGTTQDSLTAATNFAQTQQTQLQSQISTLQDTDMTSAITDMTQTQTQEQAALAAEGRIPRTTLFDFLVS